MNELTVTIPMEEYKELIRQSISAEFIGQIEVLKAEIERLKQQHEEELENKSECIVFQHKRHEEDEKKIAELEEKLSFYEPLKTEEAS